MSRRTRILSAAGAALGLGTLATRVADRLDGFGTRPGEAAAAMPGDHLHDPGATVRTRAITVAAPPADVWPWLVQLGWGRAGWYSLDALERPLGAARSVAEDGTESWRSLTEVAARHQDLAVGDRIPLAEGLGFEVVEIEPLEHLVAVLETDALHMVWTLVLRDFDEATRLVARTALRGRGTAADLATRLLVDPGHAVMEVAQLRGIKRRAEGYFAPDATVK